MEADIGGRVKARMAEFAPSLTHREIGASVDMTPDAFSRALAGKRAFTAIELAHLAKVLQTSTHWFITGEPDPFAVRVAGRHTFDHELLVHEPIAWHDEARPIDNVALAYVQAYGDRPPRNASFAASTAAVVRARLLEVGGDDYVRHFADVVELAFGIDIVRLDLVERGFAMEVLGFPVILLNETGNWFFENWTIAHELSHILKGELSELGDSACDDPAAEKRANAFAADLLLPQSLLNTVDWFRASASAVAEFVWASGVSTESLRTRLAALKVRMSSSVELALRDKTQALLRRSWAAEGGDPISDRMQQAAARRFPAHLIESHRTGVAEGHLRVQMLAWMLGVDENSLADELAPPRPEPDIDWLAQELGLANDDQ